MSLANVVQGELVSSTFTVECPVGIGPGATVGVVTPDGQSMETQVPAGILGGMPFRVAFAPLVPATVVQGAIVGPYAALTPAQGIPVWAAVTPSDRADFERACTSARWNSLIPIYGPFAWCSKADRLRHHPGNPRPGRTPPYCPDGECDFG